MTQTGEGGLAKAGRGEILVLLAAGAMLVAGWRLFWFLTDDAYIAFRYVSNRMLGLGFVWNAPPFLPVEGYTSFAWILILEGIWRVFGIEPPRSANVVSLVLTMATLGVTWSLIRRRLDVYSPRTRLTILAGLVGFLVTNRTFLTWASSGLETGLFVFLIVLWVDQLVFSTSPQRLVYASLVAAALELTRPDGLLFCAATFLVAASDVARGGGMARIRRLVVCAPLLLVVLHELWRFASYGAWLPNTYHAKYVAPWPEAGLRYTYCFVLENGLWVPLVFLAFVGLRSRPAAADVAEPAPRAAGWIVTSTLILHAAYYALIIGGDHFEYRVFAHLLPLGCIALACALRALAVSARTALALVGCLLLASWPIPWAHWALSRDVEEPRTKFAVVVPVAPAFPPLLAPIVDSFDRNQAWLIGHLICARQQDHKAFWRSCLSVYPTRRAGAEISGEGYPVLVASAVGVVSWVLPYVYVLDASGLNDFVVARLPPPPGKDRAMAHDRAITYEYMHRFRPNVVFDGTKVVVERRARPLTEEDIRRAETEWRARVQRRGR